MLHRRLRVLGLALAATVLVAGLQPAISAPGNGVGHGADKNAKVEKTNNGKKDERNGKGKDKSIPTETTTTTQAPRTSTTTTTAPPATTTTTTTSTTTTSTTTTSTTTTSTTTTAPPATTTTTTMPPTTTTTTTTLPPQGSGLGEGSVGLLVHAKAAFDPWTEAPSVAAQQAMRDKYDWMVVYSPYFDSRLSWYSNGLAYIDAYAIYVDPGRDDRSITNPEWILRDASGNPLYIPYACSGGTCPQWAGDFGNQDFRNDFLDRVQALVDQGYAGIMLDDVNLEWRVSDGFGNRVIPIDPRTGAPMELQDWRRYFAEFLEQIRSRFPNTQIMHNVIWYADSPTFDDPYVTRQIAAADYIMLERGANDSGLVGGTGKKFALDTFLRYTERADELNADVLLLDEGKSPGSTAVQTYNLAAYFLINSGGDLVSTEDYPMIAHDSMWSGYTVDLGDAIGQRFRWEDLHRRDFTGGMVLLNEPDAPTVTVTLPGTFIDITGNPVTTVTLAAETAAILRNP